MEPEFREGRLAGLFCRDREQKADVLTPKLEAWHPGCHATPSGRRHDALEHAPARDPLGISQMMVQRVSSLIGWIVIWLPRRGRRTGPRSFLND